MLVQKNRILMVFTMLICLISATALCSCQSSYNDPGKSFESVKTPMKDTSFQPIGATVALPGGLSESTGSSKAAGWLATYDMTLRSARITSSIPPEITDLDRFNEGLQDMKDFGYSIPGEVVNDPSREMQYLILNFSCKNTNGSTIMSSPGAYSLHVEKDSYLDTLDAPTQALYVSESAGSSKRKLILSLEPHQEKDWYCVSLIPKGVLDQGSVYVLMASQGGGPEGIQGATGFTLTKETCETYE